MNQKRKFTYLGIDESGIGGDSSRQILVGAYSQDELLVRGSGLKIAKARDYILDPEKGELPGIEEMRKEGMQRFSWAKNRGGNFSRQIAAHASIGELVLQSGVSPDRLVVVIDRFHNYTPEILSDYLARRGYRLDRRQIEIVPEGDTDRKLVNYADIIAFQIGEICRRKQDKHPIRDFPNLKIDEEIRSQGERINLSNTSLKELELLLVA